MFAFSLLLLVLMVHDSHGETCSCDGKIESLRKEVSRIASENKIMKSQLSDFQRIKNISGEIDEFRSMQKRQSSSNPAFYAFLSNNINTLGDHHPIQFDTVITDNGQSYNHFTGTFTVPATGLYIFTWTVYVRNHYCPTELVLNTSVIGASIADSEHDDDNASATAIVVIQVNVGDAVFIRTKHSCLSIFGGTETQSSFSGWKLS